MRQNRRDEAFRLKMNQAERQALQALAETDGDSQSAIIRRLLRKAAHERGLWRPASQLTCAAASGEVRA